MRSALQKAREAPSSTKARILAAAEQVFAEEGFAGASTRAIAAKARVNISSLHYHWESKETLYFAVFQNISSARDIYRLSCVLLNNNDSYPFFIYLHNFFKNLFHNFWSQSKRWLVKQ